MVKTESSRLARFQSASGCLGVAEANRFATESSRLARFESGSGSIGVAEANRFAMVQVAWSACDLDGALML